MLHEKEHMHVYRCDAASIFIGKPEAVVFPTSTEQVSRIVKLCNRERIPFVPRGAGTGLSGGAVPLNGGMVIETSKMNKIVEVDLENQRVVVEAGLINLQLTDAISEHGYYYAPDPSSQQACTLGGNVAHNSGGPHCLKYGVTTSHVLGLEVVLPDGQVVNLGGKALDSPGYDLTGILVGSEGTIGIVTRAILKIQRKPQAAKTFMAVYDSIDDASNTVSGIIAEGIVPAAVEMADKLAIKAIESSGHASGYPLDAAAVLLIEVDGLRYGMDRLVTRILEICKRNNAREIRVAKDDAERKKFWTGRKGAFAAMGSISPNYVVQDGVIPRTKLPEVLRRISEISTKYGLSIANVFHAGDGNLHPLIIFNAKNPGETERALQASAETLKICVEVGGVITGEHGIGIEKRDLMPLMYTPEDLAAMKKLREVFNPNDLCNPMKIFPTRLGCVGPGAY